MKKLFLAVIPLILSSCSRESVFVWTFDSVITVSLIGIGMLFIIIGLIKHVFNVIFKKNCRRCKHCYLYSVPSVGDGATYKCNISEKNRIIRKGIDSEYTFCKNYTEE